MPRYFFHTANGSRERDTTGTELSGPDEARIEAIKFSGAVLNEQPGILGAGHEFSVEVTDELDLMLFTIITLVVNAPASGRM